MRCFALIVGLFLLAAPALAAEPVGCDGFKWSIAAEQRALAAADRLAAPSSSILDRSSGEAVAAATVPFGEVKFLLPPERAPKDPNSFASVVEFGTGPAGDYLVTVSAGAWIDVVQGGKLLKSVDFSGAVECPHVRKSVRFAIGPEPFTIQLSGVEGRKIDLVVTKGE